MRDSLHLFVFLLFLFLSTPAKSESRRIVYKTIPANFEQYQDSAGFVWQVSEEGALTSGTTEYMPSGLKLHLNGTAFRTANAELVDDRGEAGELDLIVDGTVNDFTIQRQFWFDLERAAVRVVDEITNNGAETQTAKIALKSEFQFPWQNLVGTSGDILGSNNPIKLGTNQGLATKFSVTDGRQDTIILTGVDSDQPNSPVVEASANARQLSLIYQTILNPGDRIVLVHWVVRRNLSKLDDLVEITGKFIDRNTLVNPRVAPTLRSNVLNFPANAFVEQVQVTANVEKLVQLNQLLEDRSIKRSNKDTLYIGSGNYMEGVINPAAVVLSDKSSITLATIAAIEGGGNIGRVPRVFLRDGQVLVGQQLVLQDFTFKVGDSWLDKPMELAGLDVLLPASQAIDGTLPSQTQVLINKRDGKVIAVKSVEPIEVVTAWGIRKIKVGDIQRFYYQAEPNPEFRLHLKDGSLLGVFPKQREVKIETLSGEQVELDIRSIASIQNAVDLSAISPGNKIWQSVVDIPEALRPEQGFLLHGNNIVTGSFIELTSITLVNGTSRIPVTAAEIKAINRIGDRDSPQFSIELLNGNTLEGDISPSSIKIGTEESAWSVPIRHLVGYINNRGGKDDE